MCLLVSHRERLRQALVQYISLLTAIKNLLLRHAEHIRVFHTIFLKIKEFFLCWNVPTLASDVFILV